MADRTCMIEDCGRRHYARGFCVAHYRRWWKGADVDTPIRHKRPGGMSPTEAFRYFMPGEVPDAGVCWLWRGRSFDKDGYGLIGYDISYGGSHRANRASYEYFVGPIADGLLICHTCDNPACVNPAHLYAGTSSENTRDQVARGRIVIGLRFRGQDHPNAKLTNADAEEIRSTYSVTGESMRSLAARYGVSRDVIRRIVRCLSYK